jgi:cytochrome c biogenesis protein CcdA
VSSASWEEPTACLRPLFLFANIVGALMWTSVVGYLSFLFGSLIHRVGHWIAIVIDVVAVTAIVVGVNFLRRHGERLKAEAEFALPGALASRSGPHPTGSLWGLA